MNLGFYFEKLHSSEVFIDFMEKNPKAYLCSGFFSIDKEGQDNQKHFDFYAPDEKKMFSFKLESKIEKVPMEIFEAVPKVLDIDSNLDFDIDDTEKILLEKMEEQKINNKIQKILISIQNVEEKNFLICTVFISGLGLLKVQIDLKTKKITFFEKKSFFDFVKRVK
ncbi:hypothetical protein K0A97_00675 [Patescibacteria group bacterium]|nr:hypothetical protein [Patescibacteria group bacterium]